MRDGRKLKRSPESKQAEEALSLYVSPRTVALLFSHPSGAVSIGSAIAIHLEPHFFLATAAHNIANLKRGTALQISPYGARSKDVTVISFSHPRAVEYNYDVAWLRVTPESAEGSGITWLSMSDLLCGQRFDPYSAYFIQGYPASEVVVRGGRNFDLLSLGVGCISLPPDRGDDFLALEYPPQSPDDLGLELPSPEGLCDGGGIWTIPSPDETPIWSPDATRLVAIGRSYSSERVRLSTTPIEFWLSLVALDFPELRERIEEHFKNSYIAQTVLVSPSFRSAKLHNPTIDDLVDVLEDRLKFWLLEPAKKLAADRTDAVAGFNLLLSYFEGIWIYLQGRNSQSRSREFFESAFVEVFQPGGLNERTLKRVAAVFYEDARCGFFHDGMFRERIYFGKVRDGAIHITLPRVDGVVDEAGVIQSVIIDVEQFCLYVEGHFARAVARLRDPSQVELRLKFQAICQQKWNYEGDARIIAL